VACTKSDAENNGLWGRSIPCFYGTDRAASSAKKNFTGERGPTMHRRMLARGSNSAQIYRDATGMICASRMNLADSSGGVGQM
jgi:hypothetical protein